MPQLTLEERAALAWRKASASGADNCIEVADTGTEVIFRHSKDPDGPVLEYSRAELVAFLAGVKNGEFDDLL